MTGGHSYPDAFQMVSDGTGKPLVAVMTTEGADALAQWFAERRITAAVRRDTADQTYYVAAQSRWGHWVELRTPDDVLCFEVAAWEQYIPADEEMEWFAEMSPEFPRFPTGYLVRADGWVADWEGIAELVSGELYAQSNLQDRLLATDEQYSAAMREVLTQAAGIIAFGHTWAWHDRVFRRDSAGKPLIPAREE